jgi:hypothetical protein
MSHLKAAIDVAAEYAYHLHHDDGMPKPRAVSIGVAAVVRAARTNPSKFVTHRKQKETGVGWSGPALAAIGSSLSAIGWIKTFVTGG